MLDIKSPYLNSVVEPARLVTLKVIVSRLPEGRKKPMIGSIMSFTNAVTNLYAACPNTKAIARPIIPKVFRKSKNSWANVLLTSTGNSSFLLNASITNQLRCLIYESLDYSRIMIESKVSSQTCSLVEPRGFVLALLSSFVYSRGEYFDHYKVT